MNYADERFGLFGRMTARACVVVGRISMSDDLGKLPLKWESRMCSKDAHTPTHPNILRLSSCLTMCNIYTYRLSLCLLWAKFSSFRPSTQDNMILYHSTGLFTIFTISENLINYIWSTSTTNWWMAGTSAHQRSTIYSVEIILYFRFNLI